MHIFFFNDLLISYDSNTRIPDIESFESISVKNRIQIKFLLNTFGSNGIWPKLNVAEYQLVGHYSEIPNYREKVLSMFETCHLMLGTFNSLINSTVSCNRDVLGPQWCLCQWCSVDLALLQFVDFLCTYQVENRI